MPAIIKMKTFICFFLISVFYGISGICHAQIQLSHFNDFNHYTKEDGLASTTVYDIAEDKNGFLWIATGNGVSRFDGNYFTNFTLYDSDSTRHRIGFVGSILMDKSGENIWIGTEHGIFHSRVDTVRFQKIERLIPSMNFSTGRTPDLLLDNDGLLWAAKFRGGLMSFDLKAKKHDHYSFTVEGQKDKFSINRIGSIAEDPDDSDILWLGSAGGLIRFNRVTKNYEVFVYQNNPNLAQNRIRSVHASAEEVFVSNWGGGLVVFNKLSKQFRLPLLSQYPHTHTSIYEFYEANDNILWITSNDGLIVYDLLSKKVKRITDHNKEKGLLRGVSFIDSRGIIWFCNGKGLFKYDPLGAQNRFIELEERNGVQNPLLVREVIVSGNSIYVLGDNSSGLYKVNSADYSFEIFEPPAFYYQKNKMYLLRDMVEMEDGNLLIVSGNKIVIFNTKTQQFKLPALQVQHPHPVMHSVVKDRNNNYWIGTKFGGLFYLNFKNNTIINYKEEFNKFRDGNHEWITMLYLDSKNKLWIAKGSTTVMDLNDSTIHCLNRAEGAPFYQDVGGFVEDTKGRIWMAGYDHGLGFTDFDHFNQGVKTVAEGYFSGLYPYNDSLFWTTGNGLGTFNTNTLRYRKTNLTSKHRNLQITGPVHPLGNGEFVIGCENGILIYNPDNQIANREIPQPYIRKIESGGQTLYEGNDLAGTDFPFETGTKHITLKISSLGFHFADQITYQYKFDGEWQHLGPAKEINLSNLSPGDYKLNIRAFNNMGVGNPVPLTYNLSIPVPWWNTWWAYLLYLGLAILFADRFYRFQLAKRLAIAESERLKDINKLKNSLYANITHEFRTPLTVILGMADTVASTLKEVQVKGADHALELIRRNGKNLLRLVNQMLDLSKLESGKMELHLVQTDVIPFVKYIGESFQSLAREKQINLVIYAEVDELRMDVDVNKLSAILSNILSNAIKFTSPGGKIVLHLNRILIRNKPFFIIKVKDSGIGIPQEDMKHIFSRFYQVDNSSSQKGEGTGIGLALTKQFVELLNGTITVKSTVGKGSEFSFQLPVTNQAEQTKDVRAFLEPDVPAFESGVEAGPQIPDEQAELPLALIIEDNADVAHYLKTCLAGKYRTLHAGDGEAGMETAFEKVPDIIICDVKMPKKDGFEVCSTLKSDERTDHIPVIMLTAKVSTKDRLTGLSRGADAYLTKPFVKAELLTRIDQLVLLRRKMMRKMNKDSLRHFLKTKPEDPETKFLQKIIKIIHEEISNHSFGSSLQLSRKMHLSESQLY
ncbi:MAG: response regulator, partial [Chlorobi bacterium]|nr:response regulator [Chlorobiota bacterium]